MRIANGSRRPEARVGCRPQSTKLVRQRRDESDCRTERMGTVLSGQPEVEILHIASAARADGGDRLLPIRLSHTTTKSGGPARTTRYFREYLDGAYALLTRRDTALFVAI